MKWNQRGLLMNICVSELRHHRFRGQVISWTSVDLQEHYSAIIDTNNKINLAGKFVWKYRMQSVDILDQA